MVRGERRGTLAGCVSIGRAGRPGSVMCGSIGSFFAMLKEAACACRERARAAFTSGMGVKIASRASWRMSRAGSGAGFMD